MTHQKPLHFATEDAEREFWADHAMTEYLQEVKVPVKFVNLKASAEQNAQEKESELTVTR